MNTSHDHGEAHAGRDQVEESRLQGDRQAGRQTGRETGRERGRQRDRQGDRQGDREGGRQTGLRKRKEELNLRSSLMMRRRGKRRRSYLTSKRSSRAMKMPGMTMSPRPSMAKLLAPNPLSNKS
ncbi:hypothetical protein EYF80_051981 [Liparis tanakae]|uniref:Uncharacterized protein n=1 Tax=Liparis tanakae TaxID=230148 RepID=A0A4Z2FA82_9TELE|nr:hypothetical protein EYF80_051981 [Liparis tanakae]